MTVAELLARVSSRELSEWMAFYTLEPFGTEAYYYGFAIVAATVANAFREKGSKAFSPEDFMPKFEKQKQQTIEEMLQFAEMMTIAHGGQDLRE